LKTCADENVAVSTAQHSTLPCLLAIIATLALSNDHKTDISITDEMRIRNLKEMWLPCSLEPAYNHPHIRLLRILPLHSKFHENIGSIIDSNARRSGTRIGRGEDSKSKLPQRQKREGCHEVAIDELSGVLGVRNGAAALHLRLNRCSDVVFRSVPAHECHGILDEFQ
jgi:hypothetical protein